MSAPAKGALHGIALLRASLLAGVVTVADLLPGGAGPALSAPTNLVPPSISGTPEQGQTLTATYGSWTGNPIPHLAGVWKRDGVATGNTTLSYFLTSSDLDTTLTFDVTGTNSQGSDEAISNSVGPVVSNVPLAAPSVGDMPPMIMGGDDPVVGATLMWMAGMWNGNPTPTVTAEWYKDAVATGIDGATDYVLASGDIGSIITIVETATNSVGTTQATSDGVGPVIGARVTGSPTIAFDVANGWVTGDNPPKITFTLPATDVVEVGDWIARQYADNPSFTGSVIEWHQVTSDDIISDYNGFGVSFPFGTQLAGGLTYFRGYTAPDDPTTPGTPGTPSAPSATISDTVNAPVTASFVASTAQQSATTPGDLRNSWTFTDIDFEDGEAVFFSNAMSASRQLLSVTFTPSGGGTGIAGTNRLVVTGDDVWPNTRFEVWSAPVTAGNYDVTIVYAFSDTGGILPHFGTLVDGDPTPISHASRTALNTYPSTTPFDFYGDLTTPAGGITVIAIEDHNAHCTTFSGGTLAFQSPVSPDLRNKIASGTSPAAPTLTHTGSDIINAIGVVFQPA